MSLRPNWLPGTAAATFGILTNAVWADDASAHVKWFCAFDVAGQPRNLENVLCANFELLVGVAVLALVMGCLVERTPVGVGMNRAFDRVFSELQVNTELMFRAGCGFFFVAIWAAGGILLTPELKTTSTAIGFLHLAIAAGMLWRRTLPLSALGILVLFMVAILQYGAFHLADYPVFLGVAAYLALIGVRGTFFGNRPLDVVRWAAAITLMWASIEKWAYPQWTFPLINDNPAMTFGYDPEFFMQAAGVVEFTLAFALIWTPLVRRVAAIMLAATFISAIAQFGKIDAIGHALIIVVLVAIAADNVSVPERRWNSLLAPAAYCAALAAFLTLYYVSHAAIFGTGLT
jgi:hypothetical protein